jgi:hypothetical protein
MGLEEVVVNADCWCSNWKSKLLPTTHDMLRLPKRRLDLG